MKSRNTTEQVGNIGADPEFRTFSNGSGALKFRLATTRRKKDGDSWVDVTHWHNIVLYNKFAENYADRLRKGDQVFIRGSSETRDYQDKEGRTAYVTEINVRSKYEGHDFDIVRSKNPPFKNDETAGSGQWGSVNGGDDIPF